MKSKTVRIEIKTDRTAVVSRIVSIARRRLKERFNTRVVASGKADCTIILEIEKGIGAEGFRIADGPRGAVRIIGNDERGLLYGVGKFLRDCRCVGGFVPGGWRGASAPEKPVRGAYFATHFHNFHHDAPVAEVERYLEELALWGINVVSVWFDMHHYRGIDDPNARRMVARLKSLLKSARKLGLATSMTSISNEAYANSPAEMRADYTSGHDGYTSDPGGHYHLELCPSKPGAKELLLKWAEERLQAFSGIGPDYLWIWPYDQGGCTCSRCAPWGSNGFLAIAEPMARLYRERVPNGKVILSTWYFDHFTKGEWEGLARAFEKKPDWVDYLMVDDNGDRFPEYPLCHGVPGGFPMLSFPEISMYRCLWGGVGANPLPHHLQSLWDSSGQRLAGGFPYSEGIYEDLNKVIIAQLQWTPSRRAMDVVKEYIASEYSPEVVKDVAAAVEILEKNIAHSLKKEGNVQLLPMERTAGADRAWSLVRRADSRLSPRARKSWRWRILYLRALIDAELAGNGCRITSKCEAAFRELVRTYHARKAALIVSPPTREALKANRGV
jgi:hypothetical protein